MKMKGNSSHHEGDDDHGSEAPDRESKRGYSLAGVDGDAMLQRELQKILASFEAMERRVGVLEEKLESFHHSSSSVVGDATIWEAMMRRVEVLEKIAASFHRSNSRSSFGQFDPSQRRGCQLHFDGKLPAIIYTGNEIEFEDSKPVKILLLDASKKIIRDGHLSSIKVEIVPLHGDFGANDQGDWTEQEFNEKIVHAREGKPQLVTGESKIRLRKGVGYINNVSFTDNSSWTRTGTFILGARAVPSESNQVSVREARSEPITVKDQRGEYNKKHYPPKLGDQIWRLKIISRGGAYHKRLSKKGITTIEDFLRSYDKDQSSPRKLLGRISDKRWKTITEHATAACVPGQKDLVQQMVRPTYKNMNHFVQHDEPLSNLLANSFANPSASLQHSNFVEQNQDMHLFHQLPLDRLEFSQQENEARRETQPQNHLVPHSMEGEIPLAQQSNHARVDEEGTNANQSLSPQHLNFVGQKQGTLPFLKLTSDRLESSQQMMRHTYKNMNDNVQPDSLPLIQQVHSFANPTASLQHSNFAGLNQDMHQFHQLPLDRLESSQQEMEARRETQPQNLLVPHSVEGEILLAQQSKRARVDEGTSTTGMAAEPGGDDFFNCLTFGGISITGNAKEVTIEDLFNSCSFDCTSDTGMATELRVEDYFNLSTVHCTSANGMNGMDTELTLASTNAKGNVGDNSRR